MSTEITKEVRLKIRSDWTDTDGILIQVVLKDDTVTDISMSIHDPMRNKEFQFLLPHKNNLDSLRALQLQIGEVLTEIAKAIGASGQS